MKLCRNAGLAAAAVLVLPAFGCTKRGPREITEVRLLTAGEPALKAGATSEERFPLPLDKAGPFEFARTPGWKRAASTQMRPINFSFGPEGKGEVYVAVLPGAGGGLTDNVNRWRTQQMGLDPYTDEEIAALPRKKLLRGEGVFVSFDGSFKKMGTPAALPGYRLVGVIAALSDLTIFVKMTGPAESVRAEEANFDRFCASLNIVATGG